MNKHRIQTEAEQRSKTARSFVWVEVVFIVNNYIPLGVLCYVPLENRSAGHKLWVPYFYIPQEIDVHYITVALLNTTLTIPQPSVVLYYSIPTVIYSL